MLAKWHEPPEAPRPETEALQQSRDLEQRLLANWKQQRGAQLWPLRSHFDPVPIVDLLPFIAIVESLRGEDDFSYRLTGTEIDRHMSRSLTGLRISDIRNQNQGTALWNVLQKVVEDGLPVSESLPFIGSSFDLREVRVIGLPYSLKGEKVDQIVLGFTFVSSGLV